MTPDLAELKRIAEAATPFEDADQLSVLKAYIGATPPSVVLALITKIEALEEERDTASTDRADELQDLRTEIAAQATRIEALEAGLKGACDLLAERTHGSPARSPGHNARLRLERALGDRHD